MNIKQIKPDQEYSLKDILEQEMIPGLTGYAALYNLVTERKIVQDKDSRMGYKRVRAPFSDTTKTTLKAKYAGNPWRKNIKGKIVVMGEDLVAFRKLHGLV